MYKYNSSRITCVFDRYLIVKVLKKVWKILKIYNSNAQSMHTTCEGKTWNDILLDPRVTKRGTQE